MAESKAPTPAYVPFKTFISVLDSFSSFLPDKIDPTMWPSYSGGIKSQLMGALKFLGLITEDNQPTPILRALADVDPAKRATEFRTVMKAAYSVLMSLDLTKATPGSFDAEMRKYGQEGDTHRKAASFFLQAAKWSGVPLSPLLLKKGGLSGSRRKRVSTATAKGNGNVGSGFKLRIPASAMERPGAGSTKEIVLSGGVKVSLSTDVDLFRMTSDDRKFVMGLLDEMEAYEDANAGADDGDEEEQED